METEVFVERLGRPRWDAPAASGATPRRVRSARGPDRWKPRRQLGGAGGPALPLLAAAIALALGGCAAERAARPIEMVPATSSATAAPSQPQSRPAAQSMPSDVERLRADPLGYLREVGRRCAALEQYTLTFTRQERRGLGFFKTMHAPERIACRFRRRPFSVYMRWLDPDVKYGESVYVAGQADDKVRFVPRHGLLGLPPTVTRVDLQTPVTWGEARYPLTDFGLARLMERTLATLDRAGPRVRIHYLGLRPVPQRQRRAYALRFDFDPGVVPTPVRELYIDPHTRLPVCTRLFRPSGALEAAYWWEDVDTRVNLTDDDFRLDAERPKSPPVADRDPPPARGSQAAEGGA